MPRRKCIWKSLSSGAHVVSPLSQSLTLPPGSSHCVTCRTGHTRTAFPSARPGPSILHFLGNWCLLLTLACELAKLRVSPQPTEMLTDAPVKAGRRRVLGIEDESRLMRGVGCPDVLFAGLSIMKLSCGLRFARRWDCEKASLFKPRHLVMGLLHNYTNNLSQVNFCQ